MKWIPKCFRLTIPLTRARENINKVRLPGEAKTAIASLKTTLVNVILAILQPGIPLTIKADASDLAMRGMLSQPGMSVAFY